MLTTTVLSLLLVAGTALTQSGCPATPDTSVPCTGNVTNCRFGADTTCCNGAVQFVGQILSCEDGRWQVAIADGCLFGCSEVCPEDEPKSGENCAVSHLLTCNYENSQAKCVGGKWSAATCKSDADCGQGTFCWGEMCIFYQQQGEPCEGFTARPLKCEPPLPCIPPPPSNPPIADRPGRCGCRSDSECGAKAFCWDSQCIPYKQAGEFCGGFTRVPSRCDPALTCIPPPPTSPPIADLPGKCGVNSTGPAPTCPPSPPTNGGCSGDLSCRYGKDTTCCDGTVQFVGSIAQCLDGGWLTAVADGCLFGCEQQCPAKIPKAGERCTFETTKTCKYSGGKNARCVKGKWQLEARPAYFGLGEAVKRQLKP